MSLHAAVAPQERQQPFVERVSSPAGRRRSPHHRTCRSSHGSNAHRMAVSSESSTPLRRIGESLEPLPDAKTVLVLGYGFGRFNARTGGVVLMDGYEEATVALQRARVAVFTLNVTQANFNSLQA